MPNQVKSKKILNIAQILEQKILIHININKKKYVQNRTFQKSQKNLFEYDVKLLTEVIIYQHFL